MFLTMSAGQVIGPTNLIRLLSGPAFCLTPSLSDKIWGTLAFISFIYFKFLK
jgi:hypothetical protein